MAREFTEAEAARHNDLVQRGWSLAERHLQFNEGGRGRPGWFVRSRLNRAIRYYEEALRINPEGWSSMWALGKIYQRLGQHRIALVWFRRAFELNADQPDVAREAGLSALDCGEVQLAVDLCTTAKILRPEDPGLRANLALAYMMSGDDTSAIECAQRAVAMCPEDEVSKSVLRLVNAVANGSRNRPRALVDIKSR
ncbi:MAG: tetratricopeptide repeat protein [Xanthomonadales bacterium]|nr:tetratricopeptide repeat protein [Xanthomonadales bacterium]